MGQESSSPVSARDELLRQLEPLNHDARMRRMVELGRQSLADSAVAATLIALDGGDWYARRLAVQSCFGSGDGERVLRAIGDPSRVVRRLAVVLVPLVCDDRQAELAVLTAPRAVRPALLRRLARRGRRETVTALLDRLAERRDRDLVACLPYGTADAAARHLGQMVERASASDWYRLAKHHPELAFATLLPRLQALDQPDHDLIRQANAALPAIADVLPERALELVRVLSRRTSSTALDLQLLAEHRPAEVVDLLLAGRDRPRLDFARLAPRLDDKRLAALGEREWLSATHPRAWFRRLAPERRRMLYERFGKGWRDQDGRLDHALVALLPADVRELEARRHLELTTLAARPAQRLPYAGFLPWPEAHVLLQPALHDAEAELRGLALSTLTFAMRYQRARAAELLALLHARRNEQDPVRSVALAALAALPPGLWRAEQLEALGAVVRDALDARDLSEASAGALERLALRLVAFHPAWTARWLATVAAERGRLVTYDLGSHLSQRDLDAIAPTLVPVLQSWETREREGQLLAVARRLGRRLRDFTELLDLLERLVRETRAASIADGALGLLEEHRPERLAALVPELIGADPSWATRRAVHGYLHRRRQDLLTPFLGQRAYPGRFSTGKTRFVPHFSEGFARWTPAQQRIYASSLENLVRDQERDSPTAMSAIRRLGALASVEPTTLLDLARAENPRTSLRDSALAALGTLDEGRGVPALIEALGDARARVAVYALREALLELPADQALPILRAAPLGSVAVAKEVVRLIGELRSDEAFADLLQLAQGDLHRDVQIALFRALWDYLERPQAWEILERAAETADAAQAVALGRVPTHGLPPEARRRAVRLVARLLEHGETRVRVGLLQRCVLEPLSDPDRVLASRFLTCLASPAPDEYAAAAGALFVTHAGIDASLLATAIERALPNRRALQVLTGVFERGLSGVAGRLNVGFAYQPVAVRGGAGFGASAGFAIVGRWPDQRLLPAARAVVEALARDPLVSSLRVALAANTLPASELAAVLASMAARGELHADALVAAEQAMGRTTTRTIEELTALESQLGASDDERLRRLALAVLVAQARAPRGWDPEHLARLQSFRADPEPLVASAAQFTFPSEEL